VRNNKTNWSTILEILLHDPALPHGKGVALCRRFAYKQPDSNNFEQSHCLAEGYRHFAGSWRIING